MLIDVRRQFLASLHAVAGGPEQVVCIGPFTILGDGRGGVLATTEIRVSAYMGPRGDETGLHIGFVGVGREDRRKGNATAAMRILTEAADVVGIPCDLDVIPMGMEGDGRRAPVSARTLSAFYARFGFAPVRDAPRSYRYRPARPRPAEPPEPPKVP